ncbi:hypothetical protein F5Y10DRAFT_257763 [Nemania abortiva]|nr:hypothetical protein F5Y10DRAFT_257763 [Nemania abortiva]
MCKKVEEALDNGHIVLVPADNKNPDFQSRSYDIKLIVLDNTLFKKGRNVIFSQERSNGETKLYLWNDVDGKTLDFRGVEERPARKYLYFHYLHTVTRLAGQKARGWEYGLEQLGQVCESWATPGSYLTKGLINKFKGQASKTFRELKIGGVAGKLLSEEGKKEIDALLDSGFRSPD